MDVRVTPDLAMLKMSAAPAFPVTLPGPEQTAEVKTTGVKAGREAPGSPPSLHSMIHSAVLPLWLAPGGAPSVMEKNCLVEKFANVICPALPSAGSV